MKIKNLSQEFNVDYIDDEQITTVESPQDGSSHPIVIDAEKINEISLSMAEDFNVSFSLSMVDDQEIDHIKNDQSQTSVSNPQDGSPHPNVTKADNSDEISASLVQEFNDSFSQPVVNAMEDPELIGEFNNNDNLEVNKNNSSPVAIQQDKDEGEKMNQSPTTNESAFEKLSKSPIEINENEVMDEKVEETVQMRRKSILIALSLDPDVFSNDNKNPVIDDEDYKDDDEEDFIADFLEDFADNSRNEIEDVASQVKEETQMEEDISLSQYGVSPVEVKMEENDKNVNEECQISPMPSSLLKEDLSEDDRFKDLIHEPLLDDSFTI